MNSVLVIFSVKASDLCWASLRSGKTEWSGYYHSNKSDGYHLYTFLIQSETDNWANHWHIAKTVEALILFPGEYHTWGCNIPKGNHWWRRSNHSRLQSSGNIPLAKKLLNILWLPIKTWIKPQWNMYNNTFYSRQQVKWLKCFRKPCYGFRSET